MIYTYILQAFPVAYILMRRKTEATYQSIFEYIHEMCNIRATNIITDYELALTNALGRVFNNVHLQKCWFNMVQVRFFMTVNSSFSIFVVNNNDH